MKTDRIQQVFIQYDTSGRSSGPLYRFCPACGGKLKEQMKAGRMRPICSDCNWVSYRNPAPGVSVIIEDEGRILLGRRRKGGFAQGKWCLPGGFIEFDEDFLTAAKREVTEETGFEVKIKSIVNVTTNHLSLSLHTLAVVLLASPEAGELKAGDDISELRWLSQDDPLPEMAFDADRYIIERHRNCPLAGLPVDDSYS